MGGGFQLRSMPLPSHACRLVRFGFGWLGHCKFEERIGLVAGDDACAELTRPDSATPTELCDGLAGRLPRSVGSLGLKWCEKLAGNANP
jgi:hypothetical protein